MRRRTYLALMGAPMVAGCSGGGGTDAIETTDSQQQGDSQSTETNTPPSESADTEPEEPTPTETSTPEPPEPDIVMGDHSLGYDDSGYSTYAYVEATVENQGDVASGPISLTADWFDAEGNYLDDSREKLESLGAGETWEARVYSILTDAEKIEEAELIGEFGLEPPHKPEGLELVSSRLLAGENEVKVRGEIENTGEHTVDYVEFIGKVYNGDGAVMGSARTNHSGFEPGRTWLPDPTWDGRERNPEAEDHEVVLDDSVF